MTINSRITEAVALLRAPGPWSDDFDSIREPLADVLEVFISGYNEDDKLGALLDALEGNDWRPKAEALHTWLMDANREFIEIGFGDPKRDAIEQGLKRLMRGLQ